jgi:hypothetical protein
MISRTYASARDVGTQGILRLQDNTFAGPEKGSDQMLWPREVARPFASDVIALFLQHLIQPLSYRSRISNTMWERLNNAFSTGRSSMFTGHGYMPWGSDVNFSRGWPSFPRL